ncbi:hypothetical protein [Staphylococcus aureus]
MKNDLKHRWSIDIRDWSKIETREKNDLAHGEFRLWFENWIKQIIS